MISGDGKSVGKYSEQHEVFDSVWEIKGAILCRTKIVFWVNYSTEFQYLKLRYS